MGEETDWPAVVSAVKAAYSGDVHIPQISYLPGGVGMESDATYVEDTDWLKYVDQLTVTGLQDWSPANGTHMHVSVMYIVPANRADVSTGWADMVSWHSRGSCQRNK